jgi:hypothetical protein
LSGNAKIGIPEEPLFPFAPALAVKIYNVAFESIGRGNAPLVRSEQNITYGLVAKTIPLPVPVSSLGKLSAG